jgi:hypothetical protein
MLINYTSISALSTSEKIRLKTFTKGLIINGNHLVFEGKTLQASEVIAAQIMWENENRSISKQMLFE